MRAGRLILGVFALLAITASAYFPVYRAGYIWDDDHYVMGVEAVHSLPGLWRIWTDPAAFHQYYPLYYTSFWIEYQFWGLNPAGFHVVNVLLHALNAVLVWRILRRLEVPGAWVAAGVFALHPVHVESVAWITERRNVLSALFYLGSFLAYLHFRPLTDSHPPRRKWRVYGLSLALFLAALLSKTVTCTLPVAILLATCWKRRHIRFRDLLPLLPFFVVGLALGLTTMKLEAGLLGRAAETFGFPPLERVLIAGRAACFYLGKLVWPVPLIHVYPRWDINAHVWWQHLFPVAALILLVGLFLLRRRIGSAPLLAVLCFGVTLAPTLGFLDFGFMDHSFVADRFEYLPSLAIIALLVGAAATALRRLHGSARVVAPALAVAVLAALGVGVTRQSAIYENSETLWKATLAENPNCAVGHYNLAQDLIDKNELRGIIEHLEAAVRIRPTYFNALSDLGAAYSQVGRSEEALRTLHQALQFRPDDEIVHFNLGLTYLRLRQDSPAVAHLRRAIEIDPNYADARRTLEDVLRARGGVVPAPPPPGR